ncbi:GtrA family protein [Rhodococcus sp. D2-41]|uniref:GtrA family protein n=1 Tax=Speluncibacter jeojiensis TaxID=2710754 RepID=UPI0038526A20|nr:GtrA family protein [Rhodococcus sp. D2-41]
MPTARSDTLDAVSAPVPEHPREYPLPVEIPVTDNIGGAEVGLKTQLIRFVITGGLSGILDFSVTLLLQNGLGLPRAAAKSVGFILGTTTAYLLNRRWTFNAPPSRARFLAVVALYAVTFAVQVGIYTALGQVWPSTIVYNALSYVVAQGTATVINFVVQRVWIFKID